MGENSRSIVEFGHLLRRFNMKRGNVPKTNPPLWTLHQTPCWGICKGVINSNYIRLSLTLLCVTKARRVGRRAQVRTNWIIMESAYGNATKMGGRTDISNHLRQRRSLSYGNADKMGQRINATHCRMTRIIIIILSSL